MKSLILGTSLFQISIFDDYAYGIESNSETSEYIDYLKTYKENGDKGLKIKIQDAIEKKNITHVFVLFKSLDLTLDPRQLHEISKNCKLFIFFFDTEYYFESIDRYYAQAAHLVVLPDYYSVAKYKLLDIPAVCSFSLYKKKEQIVNFNKTTRVSFVGNCGTKERSCFLAKLSENGVHVETYGRHSNNGRLTDSEMSSVFASSLISLNFTDLVDFDELPVFIPRVNKRMRQAKGRPIEIALAGGFVLSQYSPGIEYAFDIGSEIDVFHNFDELLYKIDYYMEHAEIRAKMALKAKQRAEQNYEVVNGIRNIIEYLSSQTAKAAPTLYLDNEFNKIYSAYRIYYVCYFLCELKFIRAVKEFVCYMGLGNYSVKAAYKFGRIGTMEGLRHSNKYVYKFLSYMKNALFH